MPDFSAISAALTAVTNLINGVTAITGSLTGDDLAGALADVGSDFLGTPAE